MEALVSALPQFAGLIEKGGVVGLLLIIVAVLVREVLRLRAELTKQYGLRDKYRLGFFACKQALDQAGIKIDLSGMDALLKEGEPA